MTLSWETQPSRGGRVTSHAPWLLRTLFRRGFSAFPERFLRLSGHGTEASPPSLASSAQPSGAISGRKGLGYRSGSTLSSSTDSSDFDIEEELTKCRGRSHRKRSSSLPGASIRREASEAGGVHGGMRGSPTSDRATDSTIGESLDTLPFRGTGPNEQFAAL